MITVKIFQTPKHYIIHDYDNAAGFMDSYKTFGSQCVVCFQLLRQVNDMHWQASHSKTTG